jgi:ribose 5-phosphate isomerase B
MKILIGSDHAGYNLKVDIFNYLKEKGYDIEDMGTYSLDSCDYVDYAEKVASGISKGEAERGILICGTGLGMSIVANKFKGVSAALCTSEYHARKSREHNNSNILVMGGRVTTFEIAKFITDAWFNTDFEGERHNKRLNKIRDIENNNFK